MICRVSALISGTAMAVIVASVAAGQSVRGSKSGPPRSLVVEEAAIAVHQPGPHDGGGDTTAYPFFANISDFKMAFRKRSCTRVRDRLPSAGLR